MIAGRHFVVLALVLSVGASAWAGEPTSEDKTLALALFRQGRAALDAGRVDEACAKLEESQRLDPGGGTLLNVASCHETQGRTATAWAEYSDALGVARRDGRDDRADLARTRIAALEPTLPRVTLELKGATADVRVFRDGSEIPRAAWDGPIPLDPGDHTFEARAGDRVLCAVRVSARSGSTEPVILEIPAQPTPVVTVTPPKEVRATPPAPPSGDWRIPLALSLFGTSAIAVGIGAYYGVHALDLKRASDDACVGARCGPTAVALNADAGVAADVSTASFFIGLVAAGAGAIILITKPRRTPAASVSVGASAQGGQIVVRGTF